MTRLTRTPGEEQTWIRIQVAAMAYAYEFEDSPIASDAEYDALALRVDLKIATKNKKMDAWFKREFQPDTGMWIHKHPGLDKLPRIAALIRDGRRKDPEKRQRAIQRALGPRVKRH